LVPSAVKKVGTERKVIFPGARRFAGPEGGKLGEHDGEEEEEETDADFDAGDAGGFDRKHEDGDDKDIEHGPFAKLGNESIAGPGLVGGEPGMQPKGEEGVDFHEGKTNGEDKEYQKEKQFPGIPENDEAVINRNLVVKEPEFGDGGEGEKDAGNKAAQ
jgi:hypothetical protein